MKYQEMLAFSLFLNQSQGADSPQWRHAIVSVNRLMEAMGPYQTPRQDGSYAPIDAEGYAYLDALFDEAVASVNEYVKTEPVPGNDEEAVRHQLTKNFNKEFLAKSYIEYKNVKPNPDVPLREAMEDFRYENVTLSSDELQRVGGNLSSRVQLTVDLDGVKTRGVFTKKTAYDPVAQYGSLLDEMDLKYGKFSSFWNALDDMGFYRGGLGGAKPMFFCHSETGDVYDVDPEAKEMALTNFEISTAINPQIYPEIHEEFMKYRDDPDFFNALFDFSVKAEQLSTSIGVNETFLGIKPDDNIDVRNSAMSGVANLLGVGDLIAKSKQISVSMPDGTAQSGTFMEFVDSKDITKLDSIDEMRIYGLDAYEGKEVKAQLSNLQVLDYICGNVDRHLGNMLYKFDPNTHKLSSVKGIDNDASFLRKPLEVNESLNQLPSIRQMRVIDQAMAEKLLTIDEGMLAATLHGYGLSQEEVDAAYSRLHNLQEAIRNAPVYDEKQGLPEYDGNGEGYGITIVKGEDWEKLKLEDLQATNNNFAKIIAVQNTLTTESMVTQPMKQNAELSRRSLKSMMAKENTQAMLSSAKSHKPFMGTSQRYLNVLSALEEYQNAPAPEDVMDSDGHPKWDRLNDLKRAVDEYKRQKVELGHLNRDGSPAREFKGKDLSRIEDVDKIGKFVDKLLEQRRQAKSADETLKEAKQKQAVLDEFKALPPNEQQIILDQKRAQEEMLKEDLSLRIQHSLAEDNEFLENSDLDFGENLSMDDAGVNMN